MPEELIDFLKADPSRFSQELAAHFNPGGHTWKEMFGEAADEVFMAWQYGQFVNRVAKAGKAEYPLPLYMNAQLPAEFERAGEYPSGGPHPYFQAVYRAAAPTIDFYSPDIYWPDFAYWINRYRAAGNPVFIPEARLNEAPWNAIYAYGEARAFGFSPFGVDTLDHDGSQQAGAPGIADLYGALASMSDLILQAQAEQKIRALVLHDTSPRASQTVSLGGFPFRATLSRSWTTKQPLAANGAAMIVQHGSGEFLIIGSGLTMTFLRDPDADNQITEIASIEQVSHANGRWMAKLRLNGDQSDQGRALLMDPHEFQIYSVKLLTYPRH